MEEMEMGLFEEMGIRILKPNEVLEISINAEWLNYMKEKARDEKEKEMSNW